MTVGPFGYHPPLPPDAPKWRKLLRRIFDTANGLLYWSIPWL
ncbi:hypothetical protein [Nocardia transvalensis]|nr:hypothetical protein [Nocardia transvalensis]